jgi:predicted transcriptional regulator of viral defense system
VYRQEAILQSCKIVAVKMTDSSQIKRLTWLPIIILYVPLCRLLLTNTDLLEQNYQMESNNQKILALAHTHSLIRPCDLEAQGLPRVALTRLVRQGLLTRIGRGLYSIPDRSVSEYASLAEVARKHPQAIVCLLSALRFHDITTQSPFEVWLGIPNKARAPRMDYPPLRIVRISGAALIEGVEEHRVDGVPVRVTNIARTVADCFKYRNKIGLEVALEALQESVREKGVTMDDLWRFATLCRVANVMRPYMESLP